jgi:hypothetical protein
MTSTLEHPSGGENGYGGVPGLRSRNRHRHPRLPRPRRHHERASDLLCGRVDGYRAVSAGGFAPNLAGWTWVGAEGPRFAAACISSRGWMPPPGLSASTAASRRYRSVIRVRPTDTTLASSQKRSHQGGPFSGPSHICSSRHPSGSAPRWSALVGLPHSKVVYDDGRFQIRA